MPKIINCPAPIAPAPQAPTAPQNNAPHSNDDAVDTFIRSNSFSEIEDLLNATATEKNTRSQRRKQTPEEFQYQQAAKKLAQEKNETQPGRTWKQFFKDTYKRNKARIQFTGEMVGLGLVVANPALSKSMKLGSIIIAASSSVSKCLGALETKE